jgi:type I restriction enzyme S subunit
MKDRNENRPGYKKTKVGWIPQEWRVTCLAEVSIMMSNGFVGKATDHYSEAKDAVTYVQGYNVKPFAIDYTGIKKVSREFHLRQKKTALKLEDILTIQTGEIGNSALVPPDLVDANCHALVITRLNRELAIPSFYVQYLNSSIGLRRIHKISTGSTLRHINVKDMKKWAVPVPPLSEQNKIAKNLSSWDEAIEQTRKLIDAKKRRKKALMQQLLTGKRRLPGFEKTKDQRYYRFFNLPEDWECPQMKEIAKECSERNNMQGDLPVLACSKHLGFIESSEYFGKQVFSEDTSNYKIIRRGCFGFPSNHIEEGSIGLLLSHDMGLVSPIYIVFRCDESVIPEYLFAVFKTDTFRHIFRVSTNASVDRRGSLRWREFSLIYVPKPSREEQQAIVDILQTGDEEINKLEMKLNALEKQKRGLMQKLLTGEVRVKL